MLAVKYLLPTGAIGLFIAAVAVLALDLYAEYKFRRDGTNGVIGLHEPEPVRWRTTVALGALAWAPMLIALSIVVRSGMAGTQPATVYPGVQLSAAGESCRDVQPARPPVYDWHRVGLQDDRRQNRDARPGAGNKNQ